MSLNFHARLTADGTKAKVEIRGTAAELDKLQAELKAITASGADASGSLGRLGAAAGRASNRMRGASDGARGVHETHTLAAGSVGNLTAQFNDIGVMMAAGQNPLQLAIQQGTQISQVIGPMGAGKAVKALGSAFMSLLSPINLVTIGSIAAGAALVQWLTRASESADGLEDQLDAAREKMDDARLQIEVSESGAGSAERLALINAEKAAVEAVVAAEERLENARGNAKRGAQLGVAVAREKLEVARQELAEYDALIPKAERLAQVEEARATATDLLDQLRQENELRRIAIDYGEESIQYAEGLADAQRDALEAQLATLPVAEALKDEIRAATEESIILSQTDIASAIGAGASEAERLANALGIAVSNAIALANTTPQMQDEDAVMGQPVLQNATGRAGQRRAIQNFNRLTTPRVSSRGRGGGGGGGRRSSGSARAARQERDAVADLIERYEEELETLRETDPVQREMIRHRKDLADASAEERARVQELIGTIEAEEQAKRRNQEVTDLLGRTAMDVIPDLVRGGDDAAAAWGRVADILEEVAWQAILLGEGPLGGLFPDGGLVGLITGAFTGGAQARAEGGMIYGDGGPKADKVPVWMSAGEFAVNAAATARHRPLLEALNAGATLPRLAMGGSPGGGALVGSSETVVQFIDQSSGAKEVRQETEALPGGGRLQRFILSDLVSSGIGQPGGAASRTLRDQFGVVPRGTRR